MTCLGLTLAAALLLGGCAESTAPVTPPGGQSKAAVKTEPRAATGAGSTDSVTRNTPAADQTVKASSPSSQTSAASNSPAPVAMPPAPRVSVTTAPGRPSQRAADSVVTASAVVERPRVRAGDSFTLRVEAHMEPGWHIYAIDRPTGPSIPTSINFKLPKGLSWEGDWTGPEPTLDDAHPQEPSFYYDNAATFTRTVRVAKDAAVGSLSVPGTLKYQACNQSTCHAPTQEPLQVEIQIVH